MSNKRGENKGQGFNEDNSAFQAEVKRLGETKVKAGIAAKSPPPTGGCATGPSIADETADIPRDFIKLKRKWDSPPPNPAGKSGVKPTDDRVSN